jgi:putative transposase
MVSPQAKRSGVCHMMESYNLSERRGCELVDLARSSKRYRSRPRTGEVEMIEAIRTKAQTHPTYGYRRIAALLRREGTLINHKRVHRIWKTQGLQLPRRRERKRRRAPKQEVVHKATHRNHVWSYDFLEDRTERGGKLRILTVLDEYTRECHCIHVARSIPAAKVLDCLEWLFLLHGVPEHIRSDNGPEFIAKAVQTWLESRQCNTLYITPGSPWENPYIESFNGRLREECLNRCLFASGREAQQIIEAWRHEYNQYRPHSALDYLTPVEFARQAASGSDPASVTLSL